MIDPAGPRNPEDECPACHHSIMALHDDIGCAVPHCECEWNRFDAECEAWARRAAEWPGPPRG